MVVRSEGQGAESGGKGQLNLLSYQTREYSGMGSWEQGSGDGCQRHLWQDSGILAPGLGKPFISAHSRLGEGHGDG